MCTSVCTLFRVLFVHGIFSDNSCTAGQGRSSLARLLLLIIPFTAEMVLSGIERVCKGASAPALALIGFALLQPSAVSAGKASLAIALKAWSWANACRSCLLACKPYTHPSPTVSIANQLSCQF